MADFSVTLEIASVLRTTLVEYAVIQFYSNNESLGRIEKAMGSNETFHTQVLRAVKKHILSYANCDEKKCYLHQDKKKQWEKVWSMNGRWNTTGVVKIRVVRDVVDCTRFR